MSIEVDSRTLQERFELAHKAHKGMIRTFAWNCYSQLPGMDRDDIAQELLVVLWRCVQKYDPNRGASFSTLFQGSARNHIIGLVRAANVQKRGKGRIVALNDEDFARAAEQMRSEGSAEDWFLALDELGPRLAAEVEIANERLAS